MNADRLMQIILVNFTFNLLDVCHFLQDAHLHIGWKFDAMCGQMQLGDHILQCDAFLALQCADLLVARVKRLGHQTVHNQLDVRLARLTAAGVHTVGVHPIVRHRRTLQQIDHLAHVAAAQLDQRLLAVLGHVHVLHINHLLQSRHNLLLVQRSETKARTSRLQRRYDLGQVVADQTETNVVRVLLNDSSQGILGITLSVGKRLDYVIFFDRMDGLPQTLLIVNGLFSLKSNAYLVIASASSSMISLKPVPKHGRKLAKSIMR